jgi:hypothetical protein
MYGVLAVYNGFRTLATACFLWGKRLQHNACLLLPGFQDPSKSALYNVPEQVEKAAAAREEVRVKSQQQGWDERRIDGAARALKDKQQAWEEAEYDRQELFKGGGLNYYFSRFCNTLVQVGVLTNHQPTELKCVDPARQLLC